MDDHVTTGAVARALGVTINTVKAWVRRGDVDAVRLPSGHYRIPRRELDRLAHERAPERWRVAESASSPAQAGPVEQTLRWIDSVLELARTGGPQPDPDIEARVARLDRMRRKLERLDA